MKYLLGIDVGTSGTKTLLMDTEGGVVASATAEHPISSPKPLWSEQGPADWWKAVVRSIGEVLAGSGASGDDVGAVGLSGQMHGAVFLDGADEVLRPAILWNDQRTAEECEDITARVGAERLIELAANPALTGFTAPKIVWVQKNEPEVYEKSRKVLLPKDYIRFRLTGEYATEVSDASGTLLLDVSKREWSGEILDKLGIDRDLLPECFESPEVSGKLTTAAAKETGLAEGTPVVGGGGDQAAGAVGNGIVSRGVISCTVGTSGVVFAHSDEVQIDPKGRVHTFCHAVPGKWHVMGVVLAAGGAFQWFRNHLGEPETSAAVAEGLDPYEGLTELAAKAPAGCEGLIFLPYLTGERTPHADPFAKGCFVGITPRTTKAEIARAVMEGATYALRDSLEIIRGMGVPVEEIRLSGGGARSELWRHVQADVFGQSASLINAEEGPAYGVALLAGVGAGVWSSVEEACGATIRVTEKIPSHPGRAAVYDRYYPHYAQLYRCLRDEFGELAGTVESLSG